MVYFLIFSRVVRIAFYHHQALIVFNGPWNLPLPMKQWSLDAFFTTATELRQPHSIQQVEQGQEEEEEGSCGTVGHGLEKLTTADPGEVEQQSDVPKEEKEKNPTPGKQRKRRK